METCRGRKAIVITGRCDLRKAIRGLSEIVEYQFGLNPMDGSAYFFCGRRADRIKILVFDHGAYHLHYVRQEEMKFKWPRQENEARNVSLDQLT